MCSSVSDVFQKRSSKTPKLLRKFTEVFILLQIFYLIARTNGSPAPLLALPEEAIKAGVPKDLNDAREAGKETATLLTINKKDEILNTFTKNQQILEEQDSRLLGLRLASAEAEKASHTLRMDYRAALVREMKSQGQDAEKWLKELPPPEGVSEHIKDDWAQLKLKALEDYKLDRGGNLWSKFMAFINAFFRRWKWIDDRLDVDFLHLRMLKGFKLSKHDLIVLELDNVRRADIPLSTEEMRLVHRLVEVGGDESKLTETELKLIETLSGKTVAQRRLEKLSSLRIRIEQLMTIPVTSAEAIVRDAKVSQLKAALEALQDNATRGLNWTREQTKLVVVLGKVEDIGKIDKALSKAQRRTLASLIDEETTIRQGELYEKAVHRLAAKMRSALDPEDMILERMLLQRLEGASRGSTVGMGIKFTEKQNKRILKLAGDYDTQIGNIKLHTNPEAIDISDGSLIQYELPVDRRAERALKMMQKKGSLSPEQVQLSEKLHKNLKDVGFANEEVKILAAQFDQNVLKVTDEDKIKTILSLDQSLLNQDPTLIQAGAKNQELVDAKIVGEKVAKWRSKYLVRTYNEMAYSMSPEEKALNHLMSEEKSGRKLDRKEVDLKKTISRKNPLTQGERFLAVLYAQAYGVPTLENLAYERLLALQKTGVELRNREKKLAVKLRDNNLLEISEEERQTIRKLAKDNIVVSNLRKNASFKQAALYFVGEIHPDIVPLPRILSQFKPHELSRAKDLILSGQKAKNLWVHDPMVMELLNLGQRADKRMTLDRMNIDLGSLQRLMKSQHNIRAIEISELEEKFKVETETLKAFAGVLKKHSTKRGEELDLPDDVQRFLNQGSYLIQAHKGGHQP